MKKLLLATMILGSLSSFAECTYKIEEDASYADARAVEKVFKEKGYQRVDFVSEADHIVDVSTWRNPGDSSNTITTYQMEGTISITDLEGSDFFRRYESRVLKTSLLKRSAVRKQIENDLKEVIEFCN